MGRPWIKVALDTPRKPELDVIADELDEHPQRVLGALVQLWCWAADHTEDGRLNSLAAVDRKAGLEGLGALLVREDVAWLEEAEEGFQIVEFERWIGSAKIQRQKDAARKRRGRSTGRSTGQSTGQSAGSPPDVPPGVVPPQISDLRSQISESRDSDCPPGGGPPPSPEEPPAAGELFPDSVELTPSGRPSAKRKGTQQSELVDRWCEAWLETRGTEFVPKTLDFILAARVLRLAGGDLDEASRRAARLLRSSDRWEASHASFEVLVQRWNQLGVEVLDIAEAHGLPKDLGWMAEYLNGAEGEPSPVEVHDE